VQAEVFEGDVEAIGPSQQAKLTEDRTLIADVENPEAAYLVTRGIRKDNWDE
jgi:hypothetical protein